MSRTIPATDRRASKQGVRPKPSGEADTVPMRERFNQAADRINSALGSVWALLASVMLVAIWAITGPLFHFSDTWQLLINTSTTVATFWMVFVIQNSQNRNAKAVHLKLDELIRSLEGAHNEYIHLEQATEAELEQHDEELTEVASADASDAGGSRRRRRASPPRDLGA